LPNGFFCKKIGGYLFKIAYMAIQDLIYFLQDQIVSLMFNLLKKTITYLRFEPELAVNRVNNCNIGSVIKEILKLLTSAAAVA
jgi:hypothetical protein